MCDSRTLIHTDEHGVMRVGQTRVSLDSVVYPFRRGDAPESIQEQYPSLTLEDVKGAIDYYLTHTDEVDAYLRRQEEIWRLARERSEKVSNPTFDRLRALKQARANQP